MAKLWPVDSGQVITTFQAACNQLGLDALQPTRYSLRHGGASEDLYTKSRTIAEVMKRGQWRADSSLRRYAKEGRLLAELKK
eukprot:5259176-Karenia_brevis.AAC.1